MQRTVVMHLRLARRTARQIEKASPFLTYDDPVRVARERRAGRERRLRVRRRPVLEPHHGVRLAHHERLRELALVERALEGHLANLVQRFDGSIAEVCPDQIITRLAQSATASGEHGESRRSVAAAAGCARSCAGP